jgi:antitoxin HigA-1
VRALPAYARSYRLIQAWTDEGAARCSLAQQVFGVTRVVAPGSAATKPCFIDYPAREAAKRLGVTRQALSALLNGRAGVSASMALRLEAALGASAEMWLGMQTNHDLWLARKRPPKIKKTILTTEAA